MADKRVHPSIAERIDIGFNKRPDRWRRWRYLLNWCGALLPLGFVGWSLMRGDESIYQARPVTPAHRIIQHDCRACHVEAFQSLVMRTSGHKRVREIEAKTCGKCHTESTLDHNEYIVGKAVNCVECHREHSGKENLSRVADGHCVGCHSDLNALAETSFFPRIDAFASHPPFAITESPPTSPLGSDHLAHRLAEFDGQRWNDTSPFYFNHKTHLKEKGVLIPQQHPDYSEEKTSETLACSSCHQLDTEGKYLRPVSYELHCARCHPLTFSTKLNLNGPLPHGSVEAVHGVIRDRLLAYVRQNPDVIQQRDVREPAHPNKRLPATNPAKDEYAWVEAQLTGTELNVLGDVGALRGRVIRRGCEFCHVVHDRELDQSGHVQSFPWNVVTREDGQPLIPDRWFPHSRFRHDRHDTLPVGDRQPVQCLDCHGEAQHSERATDILLPDIHVCRTCHDAAHAPQRRSHARADCVECHGYHHTTTAASQD